MGFCLCALSDPFCPKEVFFGSRIPSPIWKKMTTMLMWASVCVCVCVRSQTHFVRRGLFSFKIPLQNLFTAICECILGSLLHPVDYRARGETGDSNGLFKNFLCQSWSRGTNYCFFSQCQYIWLSVEKCSLSGADGKSGFTHERYLTTWKHHLTSSSWSFMDEVSLLSAQTFCTV